MISHDNDEWAGTTLDPSFMQMGSGLHIGDFSNISETWEKVGIDYRFPLQVEGKGYVKDLEAASVSCLIRRSSPCYGAHCPTKKELCQAVNDAEDEVARLKAVVEEQGARLARLEQLLL